MTQESKYRRLIEENKVCVIIPTYNNSGTLGDIIDRLRRFTDDIIIVNDGSIDNTAGILDKYVSHAQISFQTNRGKGAALKQGFALAGEKGYKYAITIDSDGQHFPEDIPKFIDKMLENPSAIIIGERNMRGAGIPGKSSFGHKFSNFWFRVETNIIMPDTQSGYRLYPLDSIKDIRLRSRKYELEIEVIVKAAWRGVPFESVPIAIIYEPKERRISHFRPIKDFVRISILNTCLVTISLLFIKPRDFFRSIAGKSLKELWREHIIGANDSNRKLAASIGFGIFMGIVPIWGWQLVAAIALAYLFRLNKPVVALAANISIPPMIPLILFLSYISGGIMLGNSGNPLNYPVNISYKIIERDLFQYIIGSIGFAVVAGLAIGCGAYLLMSKFRKEKFVDR